MLLFLAFSSSHIVKLLFVFKTCHWYSFGSIFSDLLEPSVDVLVLQGSRTRRHLPPKIIQRTSQSLMTSLKTVTTMNHLIVPASAILHSETSEKTIVIRQLLLPTTNQGKFTFSVRNRPYSEIAKKYVF